MAKRLLSTSTLRAPLSNARTPCQRHEVLEYPKHHWSSNGLNKTGLKTREPMKPNLECQSIAATNGKVARESTLGGPCILVVDDDAEIRYGAQLRLQAAGYVVIVACDGEQALDVASRYHLDAILLDVRMPCMDGLTALGKLREHPRTADIPVVMLSASIIDQQAALEAGARVFLKKPYHARDLLTIVSTAIGHE